MPDSLTASAPAPIRGGRKLTFRELRENGVISNRVTLKRWIDKYGFPPGTLYGPNSRRWDEDQVLAWIASRPTAPRRRAAVAQ
jgi:predicted DNA-binding transcriptional regulator AlpA